LFSSGYDWCYILQANNRALRACLSFTEAQPRIRVTQEIDDLAFEAHLKIEGEYTSVSRTETFDALISAFEALLASQQDYWSKWQEQIMRLYTASEFWLVFSQGSMETVLRELSLFPTKTIPIHAKCLVISCDVITAVTKLRCGPCFPNKCYKKTQTQAYTTFCTP
jgi:hypothetical protein